jgi:hypothetical protein
VLVEYNTKEGSLHGAGGRSRQTTKETTMFAVAYNVYRHLAAAAAAAVITLAIATSFVQTTALPPGAHTGTTQAAAQSGRPTWFGQPQPATLVD